MSFSVEKDVQEIKLLRFGFENELEVGETISTFTVDVSVLQGTDATPDNTKSGAAFQGGAEVFQVMAGGVEGVTYHYRARAVGNSGLAHVVRGDVRVVRF